MPMSRLLVPVLGMMGLLAPAMAAEPQGPRPQAVNPQKQTQTSPECTCRAHGAQHTLGSEICLRTPQGVARFRCAMDLNVTSWQMIGGSCPES